MTLQLIDNKCVIMTLLRIPTRYGFGFIQNIIQYEE